MKIKSITSIISFFIIISISCQSGESDSNTSTSNQKDSAQIAEPVDAATDSEDVIEEEMPERTAANYICYTGDANSGLEISISFDKDGKAIAVKYKGQETAIPLSFVKEDYKEGGAYPTIDSYYKEIFDGKDNGEYILTHAGIWDYVTYTRGSDGKVFNFTINHDLTVEGDTYRTSPCF